MTYTIGFMDNDGEYSDMREFRNIKITKRTVIDTVAEAAKTTVLKVDEDGDGKYDLTYKAKANGRGKLVDYSYIIYIVVGVVVAAAVVIVILVLKKRPKKEKSSETAPEATTETIPETTEVIGKKFCGHCGAQMNADAKVCGNCGQPF